MDKTETIDLTNSYMLVRTRDPKYENFNEKCNMIKFTDHGVIFLNQSEDSNEFTFLAFYPYEVIDHIYKGVRRND